LRYRESDVSTVAESSRLATRRCGKTLEDFSNEELTAACFSRPDVASRLPGFENLLTQGNG